MAASRISNDVWYCIVIVTFTISYLVAPLVVRRYNAVFGMITLGVCGCGFMVALIISLTTITFQPYGWRHVFDLITISIGMILLGAITSADIIRLWNSVEQRIGTLEDVVYWSITSDAEDEDGKDDENGGR